MIHKSTISQKSTYHYYTHIPSMIILRVEIMILPKHTQRSRFLQLMLSTPEVHIMQLTRQYSHPYTHLQPWRQSIELSFQTSIYEIGYMFWVVARRRWVIRIAYVEFMNDLVMQQRRRYGSFWDQVVYSFENYVLGEDEPEGEEGEGEEEGEVGMKFVNYNCCICIYIYWMI